MRTRARLSGLDAIGVSGGAAHRIWTEPGEFTDLMGDAAWSPDGQSVALSDCSAGGSGACDIWMVGADGAHRRKLVSGLQGSSEHTLLWASAPDQLVVCTTAGAYVIDPKSGRSPLTFPGDDPRIVDSSGNGSRILFASGYPEKLSVGDLRTRKQISVAGPRASHGERIDRESIRAYLQ
jgi:WD40 repeat protein